MFKTAIRRCFDLSRIHKGFTKTNPLVGSVVIFEEKVIGEGNHEQYGKAHAEVNAIESVDNKELLRKATIFVSLEPCFHQGKTPPCVNLILEHKIPKVVVACSDPNPLVAGKSIIKMQQSGIVVVTEIEEATGQQIIRPFVVGIGQQRPYIILKFAQSADGYLGHPDRQIWLTNTFSKHLVHKWRSETDAILVGKNTAFIDNPQLTNRLYFGKKANVRILLDKNLSIKESNKIYDSSAPTWVLTQQEATDHDNIRYFRSDFEGDYLHRFLKILYENKIGTLMIEGGAKVLQSFIEAGFWDEARVFKTKKFIGDGGILAPILPPDLLKEEYQIMDDFLQIYQKEV